MLMPKQDNDWDISESPAAVFDNNFVCLPLCPFGKAGLYRRAVDTIIKAQ